MKYLKKFENPDIITYFKDDKLTQLGWKNPYSITFGYLDDNMLVSEKGQSIKHSVLGDIATNSDKIVRLDYQYPGRLWLNEKIITFWQYPPKNKLNKILHDIEETYNNGWHYMELFVYTSVCAGKHYLKITDNHEKEYEFKIDGEKLILVCDEKSKLVETPIEILNKTKIEIEDLIEYLKIEDYSYSKSLYLAIRKKNTSDNINFDNNWRIETLDDKYDTVIIPLFDYTGSFLRNKKEIETEHLDKDKNVKSGWGSKNSKNNREWRNALGEKLICNFKDFILENSNNYKNVYVDIYSRVYKDDFKQYMLDNNWDDENDAFEYYLYDEYTINIDSDGIVEFDTLNSNIYDLIGNNMVKLYHFTSSKFENNIRTNGLISGIEKTNPFNNSYSGIYLTTRTTGKEIDGYKHHIVNKHKKDVILITIKMYLDEIEPDMDDIDIQSGKTQFVSDDISPNRIISIEKVIY